MQVFAYYLAGEAVVFAGDPVGDTLGLTPGETLGEATGLGDNAGLGDTAGLGVAAGLFGTSGLGSHAPNAAMAAARTVAKINGLFIFYLKYYSDRGPTVRWQTPTAGMKDRCLSADG